jgi:hypothetical protein
MFGGSLGVKTYAVKIKIPPKPTPIPMPIFSAVVRSRRLMSIIVPSNGQEAFVPVYEWVDVGGTEVGFGTEVSVVNAEGVGDTCADVDVD